MKFFKIKLSNNKFKIYFLFISISFSYEGFLIRRLKSIFTNRKIKKLQKQPKIKVGFLVSEQAKWGYQSVYEAFKKDAQFIPVILITKLYNEHSGKHTFYKSMSDCKKFFKAKGLNVELAYDEINKQYLDLKKLGIGILFYQQPWELDKIQSPFFVSQYALTCYCAYGYELVESNASYMPFFHGLLDIMFTESNSLNQYIQRVSKGKANNLLQTGNPKLDTYIDTPKIKHNKPLIIYAPHHSFSDESLKSATFQSNGKSIVNFAKKYSQSANWIFKPHPKFKDAVITEGIMTENEINNYYKEWETIGQIEEGGDYISIFKNSDGLITDCISFLGEYLPSKKPLFHLFNENTKWNEAGQSLIDTFYRITSSEQLEKEFIRVIINKDDYKKNERLHNLNEFFYNNQKCGKKIYQAVKNKIFNKNKGK